MSCRTKTSIDLKPIKKFVIQKFVACRIRLFPILISKIKMAWVWTTLNHVDICSGFCLAIKHLNMHSWQNKARHSHEVSLTSGSTAPHAAHNESSFSMSRFSDLAFSSITLFASFKNRVVNDSYSVPSDPNWAAKCDLKSSISSLPVQKQEFWKKMSWILYAGVEILAHLYFSPNWAKIADSKNLKVDQNCNFGNNRYFSSKFMITCQTAILVHFQIVRICNFGQIRREI